jgi:uncharacterized cupredoxin-like copper-binding protein
VKRLRARRGALALAAPVVALMMAGCGGGDGSAAATVTIHFSRFTPGDLQVPAGAPVTFTLRNDDPIDHEWIVGTADVHERHRTGTEPFHATRPTEVTVPALESRETTVVFDEPGEYQFICHLPGHESYGMVGTLTVTES